MNSIRAAFYARVSSEQQATAHTIESQITALSERAQTDGFPVPPERQFTDEGYSCAPQKLRSSASPGKIKELGLRRNILITWGEA
jgi:DNA invertase Pin-like site-specific DNA recombinase